MTRRFPSTRGQQRQSSNHINENDFGPSALEIPFRDQYFVVIEVEDIPATFTTAYSRCFRDSRLALPSVADCEKMMPGV